LVSIITPTFNAFHQLENCINSITRQTYHHCEHIIVDGGSTDGTVDILKKYQHLKWISEPDKGIYDAMNKGIKLAKGEWIYFLGGDDRLYNKNVLEKISKYLLPEYDVIYGDVISTRFGGRYDGEFSQIKLFTKNICHQAIFFRKELFEKIGYFNLEFKGQADWDHNMRWFLDKKIDKKYVDLVIAEYADGGTSSVQGDPVFAAKKRTRFARHSLRSKPLKESRFIFLSELKASLKRGNLKNALISSIDYLKSL
jgi:glycosyltransferase involved in cell wall biosynthesis